MSWPLKTVIQNSVSQNFDVIKISHEVLVKSVERGNRFNGFGPKHCSCPNSSMKGWFSSGESWCCCMFSSSLQQPWPSSSPDWQVNWKHREEGTGGSYVSGVDSPVMPERGECVRCVFNSPFSRQCAAGLDVPWMCRDGVECETLGDLRRRHGTFHILFVGQNQNGCLLKVLN